jgi:hypothetical protein
MKKSRNSVKFRGISRNYTTRNSAEFRGILGQFRTEYGIDGSKKTGGIPCRRNSVDTLARSMRADEDGHALNLVDDVAFFPFEIIP